MYGSAFFMLWGSVVFAVFTVAAVILCSCFPHRLVALMRGSCRGCSD